jgi:hypothetical protein
MASYSNYPLRVPASLMTDLRTAAELDGVSMNGFVIQAVAEKVAVLRARGFLQDFAPGEQGSYLEGRAARSNKTRLSDLIGKAGTTDTVITDTVIPGDEVPDGWLPESEPANGAASKKRGLDIGT